MRAIILLVLLFAFATTVQAQWQADPAVKKQVATAAAIQDIQQRVPRSVPFFEEAYAMAVYPSVSRFGLGFGGAGGKGYVIEGDEIIGTSRYWQFTSGIQAGVRNFSMVVLFKDKEALESFKKSDVQFMGQAGLAAGTKGIAGTPAYNDGVIVFTVTRLGLMGEFTISGAKFSYRSLPTDL